MLDLRPIEDFPQYAVGRDGQIWLNDYGRLKKRKISITQHGQTKITLYKHGVPYTRSVALIVAEAWVYNDWDPEIFNTPIHLDNNLQNNHADNLAWRPRWFALKYQRQYWHSEYRYSSVEVRDRMTGEIYRSLVEVCQKYGFLFNDVINSCTHGTEVFPSFHSFCFNN